ncbi:hypothetical protein NDU88_006090 [Pleurodeles waltl]|uniref:Uncharacterized protein n=1 Tax=Pleurodeles waltl TaxID=8319 RepID=A0AAV7NS93_PLEWA|nr:hypothetical protein NDU88_006090 [Pleurodeles waltl]
MSRYRVGCAAESAVAVAGWSCAGLAAQTRTPAEARFLVPGMAFDTCAHDRRLAPGDASALRLRRASASRL